MSDRVNGKFADVFTVFVAETFSGIVSLMAPGRSGLTVIPAFKGGPTIIPALSLARVAVCREPWT